MKTKISYTLYFITFSLFSFSQSFEWAIDMGSRLGIVNSSKVDNSGNVYVAGLFFDTAFFGNSTLICPWYHNGYLAKYDSQGNAIWAKQIGSNNSDEGHSIATDNSGNILLGAMISGDSVFFGQDSSELVSMQFGVSALIAKYDSDGNLLWYLINPGPGNAAHPCVDFLSDGSCIAAGTYFDGEISFGNMSLPADSDFASDMFILKADANGNVVWIKNVVSENYNPDGYNHVLPHSVSHDSDGNIYIAGELDDTVTFDSITVIAQNSIGGPSAFIAKYNNSGEVQWVKQINGARSRFYSVKTDSAGNSYAAGSFVNNVSAGAFNLATLSEGGLVVKYDSNGNVVWAKQTYSDKGSRIWDISLEERGNNFFVSGFYATAVAFNQDNSISLSNPPFGVFYAQWVIFAAKYDTSGKPLWAITTNATAGELKVGRIAADNNNNCYLSGSWQGDVSIGASSFIPDYPERNLFLTKINDTVFTTIQDVKKNEWLNVFPNPANNTITIVSSNQLNAEIKIYNSTGEKIFQSQYPKQSSQYIINLFNQPSGIYFLEIFSGNKHEIKKIIIQ